MAMRIAARPTVDQPSRVDQAESSESVLGNLCVCVAKDLIVVAIFVYLPLPRRPR